MKPKQFKKWRKALGLNQKKAARCLGLKERTVQYYEKGERKGKAIKIPKSVALACYAINQGIEDIDFATPEGVAVMREKPFGEEKKNGASPAKKPETAKKSKD